MEQIALIEAGAPQSFPVLPPFTPIPELAGPWRLHGTHVVSDAGYVVCCLDYGWPKEVYEAVGRHIAACAPASQDTSGDGGEQG